jgi:hypothetical protein
MANERVTWVSWPVARSRMREICSYWSWDSCHADNAFVNALRLRGVSYRGKACEIDPVFGSPIATEFSIGRSANTDRIEVIVAGLLAISRDGSRVEYERERWASHPAIGRLPLRTALQPVVETAVADVSTAELAWEEFRSALKKYELPQGATPNPDSAEIPAVFQDQKKQRAAYRGALAEWMASKKLGSLRKMKPQDIASDFKAHCEAERRDLLRQLPKRLRAMEPAIERIIDQRVKRARADAGSKRP